ncbi:hypothetical protein [Lentilactobacillus hilgardii]|uniref:Uncharacterized protein n=1 Tax=Lentilactobacillus hilgardii TaxID=1588 RepID=A0A6P1E9D7_LENHI|nr:hypothetical protein [Lentilactobacillus hilgardii]EEI71803.1 hypothetical protein HMPREF0496_0947 [Lentilactobacillus hilgardii ATCC 27305]MCT3393194.1 hypothetical protein [Lentilactobacillus hilgardii]QHB51343.1 hypothetical protein GQR93_03460 [Lentilactobacillus hilgardii]RRG10357.1 MAG: hypothetical protein DUD35_08125 [Lactobacillus sp.]
MKLKAQLSATGKRIHQDTLDITKLRLNHLDSRRKKCRINWQDVYMITELNNKNYRTAIFFRTEKITGYELTTKTLLQKLTVEYTTNNDYTREELAHFIGEKEYIPCPFGKLGFIALKATHRSKNVTWISAEHIDHIQPTPNNDATCVFFKGIDSSVRIPTTSYFLEKRLCTIKNIHWLLNILRTENDDRYRQIKQGFKTFVFINRLKKVADQFGIIITEEEKIAACKQELGFYYKPSLGYDTLLQVSREFDLD